jgi:hypothetical protein
MKGGYMVELIVSILFKITIWIILILFKFTLWIVVTFYPVIIMCLIIGIPMYMLSKLRGPWKHYGKKPQEKKYRLTPQEPSVYYNRFGNLTIVDTDPVIDDSIRKYFRETGLTERNFRRNQ